MAYKAPAVAPLQPPAQGMSEATRDCMVCAVVVLLCAAGYVGRLGFYGDDWYHLAACASVTGQPFLAQLQQSLELAPGRPFQALLLLVLDRAFGPHPLGYHLVHSAVQAVVVALLYLVVRRLGFHRGMALGHALLFSVLPHYSTDLFWIAAFQAEWSILFFLAGFYAVLRAFEPGERSPLLWLELSVLCIALSLLSYEVTLGMFVLFPVAVVWRAWALGHWSRGLARRMSGYLLLAVAIGVPILFLKSLQRSLIYRGHFFHRLGALFVHAISQLVAFNFVTYGLRLPWVVWKAAHHVGWPAFLLAAAVGGLAGWCLVDALQSPAPYRFSARRGLIVIGLGCAVFFLGYGLFAANLNMDFTTTGVDNRVTIASALGAAMVLWGVFEGAAALLPGKTRGEKLQRAFLCAAVALVCGCNTVVVLSIATWWQAAYAQQHAVLQDVHQHLPTIPPGTAVLLDGVCPYVGPGTVFEASWDFGPALQIMYSDFTLRGDVVSPRLSAGPSTLTTVIYEVDINSYPYGDKLWIYNSSAKQVYKISDAAAAERYFGKIAPARNSNCEGTVGQGIPVF